MPSSATITSFFTFTQNTRAKASEVNTNYSNFRGHLIPIEPLTATSSNQTYDLGSSEHQWRNTYTKTLNIAGSTTTGSIVMTASTSGATTILETQIDSTRSMLVYKAGQQFFVEGSEVARFDTLGATFPGITATSYVSFRNLGTTDGGFKIANAGGSIMEGNSNGVSRAYLANSNLVTTGTGTTSTSLVMRSFVYDSSVYATTAALAGSTLSISAVTGRIYVIGITGDTNTGGYLRATEILGSATTPSARFGICRDTITSVVGYVDVIGPAASTAKGQIGPGILVFDQNATTGTNNYFLYGSSRLVGNLKLELVSLSIKVERVA